MERLTQMTNTILRLTENDASILRDIIRDWLSQFKDDYPNFIVQSAQQILDSLDNPDRKTIEEVYHSIKVDYDKVGETYSSDWIMPNRKAKRRKQDRREKDEYLSKHGRTPAQIKRKAKREKKSI